MLQCAGKLLQSPRSRKQFIWKSTQALRRVHLVSRRFKTTATRQSLTLSFPRLLAQAATRLLLCAMGTSTILFCKQRGATQNWSLACIHKPACKSDVLGSWVSWTCVKVPNAKHILSKTLHLCCYVHIWEERLWLVAGTKSPKARFISSAQTCRRSHEMIMSFAWFC